MPFPIASSSSPPESEKLFFSDAVIYTLLRLNLIWAGTGRIMRLLPPTHSGSRLPWHSGVPAKAFQETAWGMPPGPARIEAPVS